MGVTLPSTVFDLLMNIAEAAVELRDMETAQAPAHVLELAQRVQDTRLDRFREVQRQWAAGRSAIA